MIEYFIIEVLLPNSELPDNIDPKDCQQEAGKLKLYLSPSARVCNNKARACLKELKDCQTLLDVKRDFLTRRYPSAQFQVKREASNALVQLPKRIDKHTDKVRSFIA